MNVQNLLNQIEKVDPEVYDRFDSRRQAMKRFSFIGKTLTAAAIPAAFSAMFNKAYGQTSADVTDVLMFAYTLENLEAEFYKKVVSQFSAIGVPAGAPQAALTLIRDHEVAHVAFLKSVLGAAAPTFTAASFDFSGGSYVGGPGTGNGPFASAFTNYGLMLAVAQTFEDTGVRAYKGQAPRLVNDNATLQVALQIHSVEARHASHIRYMRSNLTATTAPGGTFIPAGVTVKPWITAAQSGIEAGAANAGIQKSYAGEDVTSQAGVMITGIGGQAISANTAGEAFDEPLTKAQVLDIVDPFII